MGYLYFFFTFLLVVYFYFIILVPLLYVVLCTLGFVDDVRFAHNQIIGQAKRLKQCVYSKNSPGGSTGPEAGSDVHDRLVSH